MQICIYKMQFFVNYICCKNCIQILGKIIFSSYSLFPCLLIKNLIYYSNLNQLLFFKTRIIFFLLQFQLIFFPSYKSFLKLLFFSMLKPRRQIISNTFQPFPFLFYFNVFISHAFHQSDVLLGS